MAIDKKNIQDLYPLTPLQEGILFHAVSEPYSNAYHEQVWYELSGFLNKTAFKAAWRDLIQRHDILRTAFVSKGSHRPLQIVLKERTLVWQELDWQIFDEKQQLEQLSELNKREKYQGFDLVNSPLLRFCLIQTQQHHYWFIWRFHHLILDASCFSILQREFAELYNAHCQQISSQLKPAPRFARFIQYLEKQSQRESELFWRAYLDAIDSTPTLPRKLTTEPGESLQKHTSILDAETIGLLQVRLQKINVGITDVLLLAWGLTLADFGDTQHATFGLTVANRPVELPMAWETVGLFINAIPVCVKINDEFSMETALQQRQNEFLLSEPHHSCPLSVALGAEKRHLIDHLVIIEGKSESETIRLFGGLQLTQREMLEHPHYDFTLTARPGNHWEISLQFNANRCDSQQMEIVLARLTAYLQKIAESPLNLSLKELKQSFTTATSAIESSNPSSTYCLASQFLDYAQRHPEERVYECIDGDWTWAELASCAEALAIQLTQEFLLQADDCIGIFCPRDRRLPVALWGTILSGAALIPIDPQWPLERINHVLRISNAKALIGQVNFEVGIPIIEVNVEERAKAPLPILKKDPARLAYIIFTSGSTGEPKGVMIEHRQVCAFFSCLTTSLHLKPKQKFYGLTTISFDISLLELLGAPLAGLTVLVADDAETKNFRKIAERCLKREVDILQITPSRLNLLLEVGGTESLNNLQTILVGGEAMSPKLAVQLAHLSATVINVYGPTETAIWSTASVVTTEPVNIGKPLPGDQLVIRSRYDGRILPTGAMGEICISGKGVARGYLNDLVRTQASFIQTSTERYYRTGDIGQQLIDGNFMCLGRRDSQIKLRGQRIELGEIEARLQAHELVIHAACLLLDEQIIAWVVLHQPCAPNSLRNYLAQWLPNYAVPTHILVIDAFPLTASGKIDRRQLRPPQLAIQSGRLPSTELEKRLLANWEILFNRQGLSIDDNFFELGGHSLLALRLVAQLDKQGISITPTTLFSCPTIAQLAQFLSRKNAKLFHKLGGKGLNLFALPPLLGVGSIFGPLSQHLNMTIYAADIHPCADLLPNLLDEICDLQETGIYYLLGYSAGGLLAWQLARELELRNKTVNLFIFDSIWPDNSPLTQDEKNELFSTHCNWANELGIEIANSNLQITFYLNWLISQSWDGKIKALTQFTGRPQNAVGWSERVGKLSIYETSCDHFKLFDRENLAQTLEGIVGKGIIMSG